jgi:hypothetical protein
MLRTLVCAAFALVICAVAVLAGEYRGKVTSVDPDKKTITVANKKEGTEKTFKVSSDTKIVRGKGDNEKEVKGGLKNEKAWSKNPFVLVTTEGDSNKAKEIRIIGGKRKKKDQQ